MREDELDDELASHLEFQVRKHMAAGMSEREARRLARIEFGGVDLTKEQCRDADPWHWADTLERNIKYAFRSLAKSPGFSIVAILILAAGIGATVAVFSVVDALLFRPLAVARPNELVRIASIGEHGRQGQLPSTIIDPLQKSSILSGTCGFNTSYESAEVSGTLSPIGILGFTGDCFRTLGIAMQLGRPIVSADDQTSAQSVAVITGRLWHSAYGGRRDVIGQQIHMPGASFTIVGVTDDRFAGLLLAFPAGVIVPLHQEPSELPGGAKQFWYSVNVIGRRAPGVSVDQARAAVAAQAHWLLEQSVPPRFNAARRREYVASRLTAESAATGVDYFLRNRFGQPLFALFGICAAILAIACVNLANLMLARALRRRREVALRLALGASRAHVAGMLALESSLLVLAGAALSVLFALVVDRLVVAEGAVMFGNFGLAVGFDARVMLFFAANVLAIGAALAGASAWQARHLCLEGALRKGTRRVAQGNGLAQKVLIAAQIALTLALVAGGTMFGSSVRFLYSIDLGVKTQNVWDAMLASRPAGYENFSPGPYYRDLVRQLEGIPSISAVVLTDMIPFYSSTWQQPVELLENSDPGIEWQAHIAKVTDGFFGIMGMRIVAGSDFRRDESGAEASVILSQSLAERLGPAAELVGKHIRVGTSTAYQRMKIVGIASNAQFDLSDPTRTKPFAVYLNSWQQPEEQAGYPVLLLKSAGGALPTAALRQVVDRAGREYVERVRSIDEEKDGALLENRVMAYLSGAFSMLALVLAATGLFGLLSYQVASRSGEIGIRMALGARRGHIEWLIVRQIAGLLVCGTAAGVGLALLAGKAIAGLLFGVHGADPSVLAVSIAVLSATALIAAWLPARRAASVDPLTALRHE